MMNSFFFRLDLNICKVWRARYIVTLLVAQIAIVAPPTFAVDATEQTHEPVNEEMKSILHNSVAVLPFENLNPNPNEAYFSAGIHQEILNRLAKIQDMSVIFHAAVIPYKDTDKSISEIASELNVETIMKGSVRYADNRFNITVQLIDPSSTNPLWSEKYERNLSKIFKVQAEIVENIAGAIGAKLSITEQKRIKKPLTNSLEAYKLYLKAMLLASNAGPVKPSKFYQYMDQAIALDADFALAHAIKANDYGLAKLAHVPIGEVHGGPQRGAGNGLTFDDMERIALEHADIALALDPNLSLAYKARTSIHRSHQRGAEAWKAFERAVQLDPTIMYSSTHYLMLLGKVDEAIRVAQRVVELAPNNAYNHANLGWMLINAGKPIDAAEQYRLAIALQPNADRHLWLGMCEALLGNESEALKQLRLVEQIQSVDDKVPNLVVAYGYSKLGLNEDAMRIVNEHETNAAKGQLMRAGAKALAYLTVGKVEMAFDILSQNPNEGLRYLQIIKSNIMKDPVLEEPRFVEVRKRIGT